MLGYMRWTGVLLLLFGCGEVKAVVDAGGPGGEGGVDAPADGPAVGEASVEVKLGGVATAGLHVVFNDSTGAVISEGMTNASGIATATVHANSMVTVAVGSEDLITVTGVNPEDHILLANPPPYDGTTVSTVTFGSSSEANGKSFYRADLGDDQYVTAINMTSGTRTLTLPRANIDAAGKIHMVAAVYNASDALISYSFVTGFTPTINGTTNIVFPSNWRTDLTNINITLSGAPADATLLAVDSANEQSGFLFAPSSFAGSDQASVTGGQAAVIVPYLGSFGDFVQTTAELRFSMSNDRFRFSRRVPRPAGAFVLGSTDMPPRLGAAALDSSTATRPVASWTTTGTATGGDAIIATLAWRDAGGGSYRWHVYVPPDATTVTFPAVSNAMAPQAPAQTSIFNILEVTHHSLDPLNGYDAFRQAPPIDFENAFDMPLGFSRWVTSSTRATL